MLISSNLGCLLVVASGFLSLASATSCTTSNAIPWSFDSDSDDAASSSAEAEISAEGEANALGLIGKRAVDLDCASSETCLVYTDDTLFCLDAATGDFHDYSGGAGNVITGQYTTSDGEDETTSEDEEASSSTASGSETKPTASSGSSMICTSDVATLVSEDDTSGGVGGGGGNSNGDAIIQASIDCAAVDAVGTSSCSRKRAATDLKCTSSETCILYGASFLFCLDAESGDFHDEYEGTGNAYSGIYTDSSGEAQTITGSVLPTPPATGTTARATATSSNGDATSTSTATGAAGNANTGSSSSSPTSAAEAQQGGAAARREGRSALFLAMSLSMVAVAVSLVRN